MTRLADAPVTTGVTVTTSARPLRADARRNRDRLLEVAADAFSAQGVEASLEEIARTAGVGIGTLYRNFPTREALVLAVYQQQVADLDTLSSDLLATMPAVDALGEWMRAFVRYTGIKRGLVGMLRSMMGADATALDAAKITMRASAQRLLNAARQEGSIRSDIDAPDLMRAMGGVCVATDYSFDVEERLKLIGLIHDGLRYRVEQG